MTAAAQASHRPKLLAAVMRTCQRKGALRSGFPRAVQPKLERTQMTMVKGIRKKEGVLVRKAKPAVKPERNSVVLTLYSTLPH